MTGSSELFLGEGVTWLTGNRGKQQYVMDLFTILVMDGKMISILSLSRDVGSGSVLQDLGNNVLMIFRTFPHNSFKFR